MATGKMPAGREVWDLADRVQHLAAATAYALQPKRIRGMPNTVRAAAAYWLTPAELRRPLPDPMRTVQNPEGFAGICPDLSVDTLVAGYRAGLYQTSHAGPYKWWANRERMVLFPDRLHLEKNLRRKLRQARFSVSFDQAFGEVVGHCASPREQRRVQLTWLLPEVQRAFGELHALGHAHSVEIWDEEGALVGGLFGVAFGRLFVTESQFAHQRDMSKVAFAVLNRHLQAWGYVLNDVRLWSSHLERLGCELIPREKHLSIVRLFGQGENWKAEWAPTPELCAGDWDPAGCPGWTMDSVLQAVEGQADGGGVQPFPEIAADKPARPDKVA